MLRTGEFQRIFQDLGCVAGKRAGEILEKRPARLLTKDIVEPFADELLAWAEQQGIVRSPNVDVGAVCIYLKDNII